MISETLETLMTPTPEGSVTIWDQFSQYSNYIVMAVVGLLLWKVGKGAAGPVAFVTKGLSKLNLATPMFLLSVATLGGPLTARVLQDEYGDHGMIGAYSTAGVLALYAAITQIRRWTGVDMVHKSVVEAAVGNLDKAYGMVSKMEDCGRKSDALHYIQVSKNQLG